MINSANEKIIQLYIIQQISGSHFWGFQDEVQFHFIFWGSDIKFPVPICFLLGKVFFSLFLPMTDENNRPKSIDMFWGSNGILQKRWQKKKNYLPTL